MENPTGPERGSGFGCYLLVIGLIVAVVVFLNVAELRIGRPAAVDAEAAARLARSPAALALLWALMLAAAGGLVLAVLFLVHTQGRLASRSPRIQPSVPLIALLVFLVSFFVLSAVFGALGVVAGVNPDSAAGAFFYIVLQYFVFAGAYALGMSSFVSMTAMTGEDGREIGRRRVGFWRSIQWGLGGYASALPFMFAALAISQYIFRSFRTPEHPIVQTVLEGGAAFWAAAVLACIVAPIVEETFFRGMLYTGLRTRMGVWPSAIISSVFFAAIHPTLPAGFLPILALGTVLAIVRERTGSLVPSMICHGVNNAVALALVRLLY